MSKFEETATGCLNFDMSLVPYNIKLFLVSKN